MARQGIAHLAPLERIELHTPVLLTSHFLALVDALCNWRMRYAG